MKKLLALILAGAMVLSMVACGGSEPAPSTGADAPAEGLKIAIVSSPSGVDDGNFNENNYNGILAFIADHPEATVTAVREETGDVAAAVQAVADIVADYDAIVCCGFQFAGIATLAEENPDVSFILVDTYPSDASGAEVSVENIYAMTFKEQESGFCQGLAAAMMTATGKVAMINGIAYPSNVNYQYGFESGVNYANKYFGTTAEVVELASYAGVDVTGANVGGNYVGNFSDEAGGKVLAEALMAEGCDVIVQACGGTGNGVLTACKEADGVYSMGSDVDQFDDGVSGDKNVILTSALKVMDKNVKEQLEAINNGTFVGGNYLLGADTGSTGYVSAEGRHQLTPEAIANIDAAFALVMSGEVVPAANFNGYTPDSFPGL